MCTTGKDQLFSKLFRLEARLKILVGPEWSYSEETCFVAASASPSHNMFFRDDLGWLLVLSIGTSTQR